MTTNRTTEETDKLDIERFRAILKRKVTQDGGNLSKHLNDTFVEVFGDKEELVNFWWEPTPDGLYKITRRKR